MIARRTTPLSFGRFFCYDYDVKLGFLRKKYPKFIYRGYSHKLTGGNLEISFLFKIPPDIQFRPTITIKNVTFPTRYIENLIFHVGLIEMLSYWKTTCSPEIIIEAGCLNKEQINWWHNLIIKGMGQFFYENKIDWRKPNFLTISQQRSDPYNYRDRISVKLKDRYLVPFTGGRDSIVTLEKLEEKNKKICLFTVNPVPKIQKVVKVSGMKKQIIVKRKIDKKLLDLNKQGYLNGHTPFTSLLSFMAVLCAALFDYKNIVFSNEKSANEGNVKYLGKTINHQWAKSSEFEKMFRNYCKKYLGKNINYFSYLRNYGELEISKMLTKYPKYFSVFSSCNVGQKIRDRWCGNCPKCLFVYLSLYPYIDKKQMLKIFGKDLFDPSTSSGKKRLLQIMKGLLGWGKRKPFECVGTHDESMRAFRLSLEKAKKSGKVPYLLKIVKP